MKSVIYPPIFDFDFYINSNPELSGVSYEKALAHFYTKGKREGKRGTLYAAREHFVHFIRQLPASKILEIGPAGKPSIIGENVRYFDIMNREECLEWSIKNNEDIASVPNKIHYVSKECDMGIIQEKFDLIFSSHNLEHQINLIQHFSHLSRLLADDGIFACVVPDKRYTFDYFRDLTSLTDILCEHITRPNAITHSMKPVILHLTQSTHNNMVRHWEGDHGEYPFNVQKLENALSYYKNNKTVYLDCHSWIFTDESFEEIFTALYTMKYIQLNPIRIYNTPRGSNSFCAIFQKKPN